MILVTGGTGLLGSHLLLQLAREGRMMRALYRDEKRIVRIKQLFRYYEPDRFEELLQFIQWIEGDILDLPSLESAFTGVNQVYHCAGLVSFASSDFKKVMKVNREGTANIVNCCLDLGIEKLCHVSSTAAIGYNERGLTDETVSWKNGPQVSGYSVSKYSAEKEVWRGIEEGLNAVIVNPCVIFGAGNWEESSLAIFRSVEKGLRFYTPGSNSFVDARDVAEIMVQLMERDIHSERYLCTGENMTFRELTSRIAHKMNKKPPSIATPRWLAGIGWRLTALLGLLSGKKPMITKDTVASAFKNIAYDTSKIRETLGFTFRTADDTIQNTLNGRIS
jgi:nucleoside-diphosphate-sugar epimerase